METVAEQQQEQDDTASLYGDRESQVSGSAETTCSQSDVDTNNNQTAGVDPCDSLSILYKTLKEPITESPSASCISDAAHRLVEGLNAKRKNDAELVERFKIALDAQTMKYVQTLEQQLYQMYELNNSQVDKKLQELFACLDNIAATETELENFRESFRKLYQEMHELS